MSYFRGGPQKKGGPEATASFASPISITAIHKYALACKTLLFELKGVFDSVLKAVNFIRGRTMNSRLIIQNIL